jgi:hypothetical protein
VASWSERLQGLPVTELPGGLRLHDAVGFNARRRGLAKLDALPPDVGLRFDGTRSIHTMGMRFDLDLVWLAEDGSVVRVDEAVPPRRMRNCKAARQVVETAAGSGAAFATALGGSGTLDGVD